MGWFKCVVNFAVVYTYVVRVDSLNCIACQNIDDPLACNNTITCSGTQVCYLTLQDGIYNIGCIDDLQCGDVAGPGIVGRDLSERQTSNCHECCSTDVCNSYLCKHQKPTTCIDDESVDCAKMNSLFQICQNTHQASLVCPKFCHLCNLVDGNWAQWSLWSRCDVTSDKGVQTRSRTCTNPAPVNGGHDCPGGASETKVCQDVCPVYGGWSKWSSWGSCSVSCDVGMQRRDRSCSNPYPSHSGDHCFGESRDDRICTPRACSDGNWSSWGSWEACSESCGGGVRSRPRTCTNPRPSLVGRYCDGSPEQVTSCNNKPCPDPVLFTYIYGHSPDLNRKIRLEKSHVACLHDSFDNITTSYIKQIIQMHKCQSRQPLFMHCIAHFIDHGSSKETSVCNRRLCSDCRIDIGSSEQFTFYNNRICHVQTVFFTANSIIRGSNPLIFSTVLYNDGGGYNSSTGKFTCPLAGVYNIATTLTKEWFYPTGWVTCFININSSEKIGGDNRPYNTDEKKGSYTETLVGTFYLAKNDIVYIHCNRVNNRSQTRPA